jgi:GTP cyclohydrolase II
MIEHIAVADFPTKFGRFTLHAFRDDEGGEHLVIENLSKKRKRTPVLVRIHSRCTTGDVFHSLRCDCRLQLEVSLKRIAKEGGLFIYLNQEGRGIGLANKIMAYSLQDKGYDTVDANLKLGFSQDERDYAVVSELLRCFNIRKIRILTNNPAKIKELERNGFIVEHVSLRIKPNRFNRSYLRAKKERMGHLL